MSHRTPGLFITGTDTGVGKTYVAALIAARAGAIGPHGRRVQARGQRLWLVQCGCHCWLVQQCRWHVETRLVSEDALALWQAAGSPGELGRGVSAMFRGPPGPAPGGPCRRPAARRRLAPPGPRLLAPASDVLLVEGAGGLLSPLGDHEYVADLAADFGFPLVVVARNVLGTINATLQTLVAPAATARRTGGRHRAQSSHPSGGR